jgi:adenosylcobinamide-phosphate guanylyltransferase
MLALILAGGKGCRLGIGEKPLVTVCGEPMLSYVIDAFTCAGHEPVVIASPACPYTANWCRAHIVPFYTAAGKGYVEDLVEAGVALEAEGPLFTCVSDLPLITPGIIATIERIYRKVGTPACSVWIPLDLCCRTDHRRDFTQEVQGVPACPAGINLLLGEQIAVPQEEYRLLVSEPRLGHNINTREDLACVQRLLCPER